MILLDCASNLFPFSHTTVLPEMVPYNFTELGAFDDRDLGALIVQENGTTVNFFVDVKADPCPDITWFFNGVRLGPSNSTFTYTNVCADAVQGSSPNWRFTLSVALTEDTSGSYTANLTNTAGTTQLSRLAYFTIPGKRVIFVQTSVSLSLVPPVPPFLSISLVDELCMVKAQHYVGRERYM